MADNQHGGARPLGGRPVGSKNRVPSKSAAAQVKFATLVEPKLEAYFQALDSIALNPIHPPQARIAAIKELLDRSMGKAREVIEISTGEDELTVADMLKEVISTA